MRWGEEIGNYQSDQLKAIRKFSNSIKIDGLKIHRNFQMNQIHTASTSKLYFQEKIGKNLLQIFKFKRDHM